ncbi:hypothetical protein D3C76_1810570 [compost metagenome]
MVRFRRGNKCRATGANQRVGLCNEFQVHSSVNERDALIDEELYEHRSNRTLVDANEHKVEPGKLVDVVLV